MSFCSLEIKSNASATGGGLFVVISRFLGPPLSQFIVVIFRNSIRLKLAGHSSLWNLSFVFAKAIKV